MSNDTKEISDSANGNCDSDADGSQSEDPGMLNAEEARLKADTIAAKETKALLYSRVAVSILLALTVAAAGTTTYFITTNAQEDDFEDQVCALAVLCSTCSRIFN
jgi:hypothetical protein